MLYFTNSDYQILTTVNATIMTPEMVARRKALRDKLTDLHQRIYPDVQKLGLRCHKDPRYLTSALIDRFTGRANTWLLIRYNNTPVGFDAFAVFTQFADIQFVMSEAKGFSVELFLGRKNDPDRFEAIKRLYMDKAQITEAIAALRGHGLQWIISGTAPFDLDTREPSEFCEWFAANDKLGEESYLCGSYAKEDERISVQNIEQELLSKIRLLMPLYRILTHR